MKIKRIIITVIAVMLMAVTAVAFTACDSPAADNQEATKAEIVETYIGHHAVTETNTTEYNGETIEYTTTTDIYEQLQLLDDGTYAMTQTQVSQNATYVVYATGTYTKGTKNADFDGYTKINLADATYVQVNQDIYNHMFSLTIDSKASTFPHEVAGGAKVSQADFLAQYGKFGARYIRHQVTVTDTAVENWIDIEDGIVVVE